MKLSIIIPYYNVKPYTDELLDCLAPQITDEVEVILIDDGSKEPYKTDYTWCQVYRQENGGASKARNAGLEKAQGEYVAFIDSDDLVADDYVKQILSKIPFDYLDMSWRSIVGEGAQFSKKLNSASDKLDNPSAVTRAWNRAFIGDVRFNENKQVAEDAEFTRTLIPRAKRRAVITDYLYFYRTSTPNSLTKRFASNQTDTKRIVYYYRRVTKDMEFLIDEIKREDEKHEVYLLTNYCEIPELSNYAMIMSPQPVRGSELRGEPFNQFTKFETPHVTQVVIFADKIQAVSGLTTFIYNFCMMMHEYYDITVIYKDMIDAEQMIRLRRIVDIRKETGQLITCDTVIVNSFNETRIPQNITYKKKLQMCHTCKMPFIMNCPTDNDDVVFVSKTSMQSWGVDKGTVINNLLAPNESDKCLLFVSCMRGSAQEKGESRMIEFASLLHGKGIKFIWLYFSDCVIRNATKEMIHIDPVVDVIPYVAMADYLVMLSDIEAYPYAMLEALYNAHTPIITTPIKVLKEIGFKDKTTGYIVPFDISETDDELIDDIVHNIPLFKYEYDNDTIIKKWRKVLGNTTPTKSYDPDSFVKVKVIEGYTDIALGQFINEGTIIEMSRERANTVCGAGYGEIIE